MAGVETLIDLAMKKATRAIGGPRTLGLIGLGIIGSRIAEAVRSAGLDVVVWNRTRKKTPGWVDSPAALAARANVIQLFVMDDAALAGVVAALKPALTREHTLINSSTVSLSATQTAAKEVASTRAAFLDAPFTGSKLAAEAGQLVYYVGGPAKTLERVRWALEPSAKTILHVGEIGQATILKITTNMIAAAVVEILSEALGVVARHGVALERFVEAMEHNASSSGLTRLKLPGMLNRDFAPHFSLKNMLKDARFAEDLAERAGVEIPVLSVVRQRMAALAGRGRGDDDYSVLATNYLEVS
jgi:3-hydroxyisobutyrate dehydrogenase-like beta-hydroxyacid dehydrogenase